jgi:uncharacterized membrane protein YiaA
MSQRNATRTYSAVQIASAAVGAVFLLVGILGFIPGVTTDYDMLAGAGHHSGAMLFGIFEVSVLHDVVHLLFGVAGLAMARMARTAVVSRRWRYRVLGVVDIRIGDRQRQ